MSKQLNSLELQALSKLIDLADVSSLSSDNLKKLIKLKRSVKAEVEVFTEAQKKLMESFKVPLQGNFYNWSGMENHAEIQQKTKELSEGKSEIKGTNFLSFEEFQPMIKNLKMSDIEFLDTILVK